MPSEREAEFDPQHWIKWCGGWCTAVIPALGK